MVVLFGIVVGYGDGQGRHAIGADGRRRTAGWGTEACTAFARAISEGDAATVATIGGVERVAWDGGGAIGDEERARDGGLGA